MVDFLTAISPLLFLLFLIIGIISLVIFSDRRTNIEYHNDKPPRVVLCLPSGEIIKINNRKWEKLIKKESIQWSDKYKYYCTPDKYSKYEMNTIRAGIRKKSKYIEH